MENTQLQILDADDDYSDDSHDDDDDDDDENRYIKLKYFYCC